MLNSVSKYIQSIFSKVYEKPELQKELVGIRSMLVEVNVPSLITIEDLINEKGMESSAEKELFTLFKNMGIPTNNDIKNSLSVLNNFSKEMEDVIPMIEKIIDSNFPDFVTDKSMTAKEAALVGTIYNIGTMTMYVSTVVVYIVYLINKKTDGKEAIIRNTFKTLSLKDASKFKMLYNAYYNKLDKNVKSINGLSNVKVYDAANFKVSAGFRDKKFNLPVNGFSLNPIYHVRKLVIDAQMEYYDYLKYKKEFIQLKIKEKELEEPSPSLEKQIKYYEEKLATLEYKIKKIEDSADE